MEKRLIKRVKLCARTPEELYEVPAAISSCCLSLHLDLLILTFKATPEDKYWESELYAFDAEDQSAVKEHGQD